MSAQALPNPPVLPAMTISVPHRSKGAQQHLAAVASMDPTTHALVVTIGGNIVRCYMPQEIVGDVKFS